MLLPCWAIAQHDHDHGHDHGMEPDAEKMEHEVISGSGKYFEVVAHYIHVHPGEEFEAELFVSDFETNKPVDSASVTVKSTDPGVALKVERKQDGVYTLTGKFPKEGHYPLHCTISRMKRTETFSLGEMDVHTDKGETAGKRSLFNWLSVIMMASGAVVGVLFGYWLRGRRKR